jgi:hypothetical protein
MRARRQARLDAVVALWEAGWTAERIALALSISRATVKQLTGWGASEPATTTPLPGTCCRRVASGTPGP